MEPYVIEATGLTKRYRNLTAVNSIAFSVTKGELFVFLGPNGAGKTTTMKMVQCVSPRSGGDLKIFGEDPEFFGRNIRRRIGVVPQETNLDPDLSVVQNLEVYGRSGGRDSGWNVEGGERSECADLRAENG